MHRERFSRITLLVGVLLAAISHGELQEIRVGGKIEIYGASYTDFFAPGEPLSRHTRFAMRGRPIGPNGTGTTLLADKGIGEGVSFCEQRTRLHVQADFSEEVSAFVEVDSIDTWGDDFRASTYLRGSDNRADTSEDVELYQSYLQIDNIRDTPFSVKIGRQELEFGSGWLVGADPGPDPFTGLSIDAVRVTYSESPFTVDAWWGKVAESMRDFGQGDRDFYGVYLSYAAAGDMTLDVYWMYLRDEQAIDFALSPLSMNLGEFLGISDFHSTNLHTAGLRWSGKREHWDWEAEAAYQWGEADALGALFRTYPGLFGDTRAQYGNWAAHAEFGHTFEATWSPRLFGGLAWYDGEDRRKVSFGQWLNPFDTPRASVSFNRLFSTWREDDVVDGWAALTNFWKVQTGVAVAPTEKLELVAQVRYLQVIAPFYYPASAVFPWITHKGAADLGWQTSLYVTYQYSADVSLNGGYTHFFSGKAIKDGSFIDQNGIQFAGGHGDEDIDYLYGMLTVEF